MTDVKDIPVSLSILYQCVKNCRAHGVSYGLGAKAPSLNADSSEFKKIDCSGFFRWALYKASGGKIIAPDGSYIQHEWLEKNGFHKVDYRNIKHYGRGRLFVGIEEPNPIGHIFMVDGTTMKTLESHGGIGPDSRAADSAMFYRIVDACYEITSVVE